MSGRVRSFRNWLVDNQLWLVWGTAFALRTTYLALALAEYGIEKLRTFASDSFHYNQIALYFINGTPSVEPALLRSGPGYGAILAAIRWIFGDNMIWPILFNLVMGSLAPIVVYLLAYKLIGSRIVAFCSALICAVSLTSISLSCQLLADQPFFTLFCLALLLFAHGMSNGGRRWFLLAGVVAGLATYIKSSGELWWLLFPLVVVILPKTATILPKWKLFRRAMLTSLVMVVLLLSWSVRNFVADDLFVFSTNGVFASQNYLVSLAVAKHNPGTDWAQQSKAWAEADGNGKLPPAEVYHRARARVTEIAKAHPDWLFSTYWNLVLENTLATNHIMYLQIPSLQPFTLSIYRAVEGWLGYSLLGLSLAGFLFLAIDRRYLAAILIGAVFAYFTLITGFSFNQGSRLHYTAEIGWSILLSYLLVRVVSMIAALFRKFALRSRE